VNSPGSKPIARQADEVPENIDAYGYLQGIYQGRWPYEPYRVRAARKCLPFERAKLAVVAHLPGNGSFAEQLEAALARSGQVLELRANGSQFEPPGQQFKPVAVRRR